MVRRALLWSLALSLFVGLAACNAPPVDEDGDGTADGTGDSPADDPTRAGCEALKADCDGDDDNGCEVDIAVDQQNCGRCGSVCADGPRSSATCSGGVCKLTCEQGFSDCDKNVANGCEADTRIDDANCGLCGNSCGGAGCVDGACACAAETVAGASQPLDLFLLIDRSGSMTWDMDESDLTGPGAAKGLAVETQRWPAIRAALKTFLRNRRSVGLTVGMQFFPPMLSQEEIDASASAGGDFASSPVCRTSYYEQKGSGFRGLPLTPVTAQFGVETGDDSVFMSFFDENMSESKLPDMPTPTDKALPAVIASARAFADAHPDPKVAVALVTDGAPSGCFTGAAEKALEPAYESVRQAHAAGVDTYVVGVGRDLSGIGPVRDLAALGSSLSAFSVDGTGARVTASFVQPAVNGAVEVELSSLFGIARDTKDAGMAIDIAGTTYILQARAGGSAGRVTLTRLSTGGPAAGETIGESVSGGGAPLASDSLPGALMATLRTSFEPPAVGASATVSLDSVSSLAPGGAVRMPARGAAYRVVSKNPSQRTAVLLRLTSGDASDSAIPAGTEVVGADVVVSPVLTMLGTAQESGYSSASLSCPAVGGPVTVDVSFDGGAAVGDVVYIDRAKATFKVKAIGEPNNAYLRAKASLTLELLETYENGAGQAAGTMGCVDDSAVGAVSVTLPARVYKGTPRNPPPASGGAQALAEALAIIRGNLIGCDFAPPGDGTQSVDFDKVNISLSVDGTDRALGRADGADACPEAGGWYYRYDGADGETPTGITLCPSSCDSVKKSRDAAISIQLGCETVEVSSRD